MKALVDSHVHVWDLELLQLEWLASIPELDRSLLSRDYQDSTSDIENVRAVYLEVNVVPDEHERELDYVEQLLSDASTPFCAAVVACDPVSGKLDAWIDRAKEVDGVRGFRRVLHTPDCPRGTCLDSAFIHGVRLIGESGMHFELCMRQEDLLDAIELARAAPRTQFVLNHFGNPKLDGRDLHQWRESFARVADEDNIVCKVSGLIQNSDGPSRFSEFGGIVDHARACFGIERLMFGSNWPVCEVQGSLRTWLDALEEIAGDWPEADRDALFESNAVRFYGLA